MSIKPATSALPAGQISSRIHPTSEEQKYWYDVLREYPLPIPEQIRTLTVPEEVKRVLYSIRSRFEHGILSAATLERRGLAYIRSNDNHLNREVAVNIISRVAHIGGSLYGAARGALLIALERPADSIHAEIQATRTYTNYYQQEQAELLEMQDALQSRLQEQMRERQEELAQMQQQPRVLSRHFEEIARCAAMVKTLQNPGRDDPAALELKRRIILRLQNSALFISVITPHELRKLGGEYRSREGESSVKEIPPLTRCASFRSGKSHMING